MTAGRRASRLKFPQDVTAAVVGEGQVRPAGVRAMMSEVLLVLNPGQDRHAKRYRAPSPALSKVYAQYGGNGGVAPVELGPAGYACWLNSLTGTPMFRSAPLTGG